MFISTKDKYKISLNIDSAKQQGLRTGDIVRRQFYDGNKEVYSLMCVLDYGVDNISVDVENEDGTVKTTEKTQPWFIGKLLEGNPPAPGELLDFVRITNLFDTDRSGALYLTASDEYSPFMDVIDGIGRNSSLCWPEGLLITSNPNHQSQYNAVGGDDIKAVYSDGDNDVARICGIVRQKETEDNFVGLRQEFYELLDDTQRVIISFRAKGAAKTFYGSVGYQSRTEEDEEAGNRTDGVFPVDITEDWKYHLYVVSIENSGRHLRDFRLDLSSLAVGEEVSIADFNIILLSSLSGFSDASKTRIGKLDGIADPVFGKLDGYGSYIQKLFASSSAHISGTLTAGDENGFAATFYAGKIHKNAFQNSVDISVLNKVDEETAASPVGIGKVYKTTDLIEMIANDYEWFSGKKDGTSKLGKRYCFSFWAKTSAPCRLYVYQDYSQLGFATVSEAESGEWHRHHVVFDLSEPVSGNVVLRVTAKFSDPGTLLLTAPQLEAGQFVTQYQPTDDTLNYCEDYGAWFSKGGVGGTIQNPLLQLNAEGKGEIKTRSNSVRINQDGSGHLAGGNIKWGADGDVEFGENVKLGWGNLDDDTQHQMESKSVRITGADTFSVIGNSESGVFYSPDYILLTLNEVNISPEITDRHWFMVKDEEKIDISDHPGLDSDRTVWAIKPDDDILWEKNNTTLTLKCSVSYQGREYTDSFTIRKYTVEGYTVLVTSSSGEVFKNGEYNTVLTAQVYYQGNPVPEDFVKKYFTYNWKKYHLPDMENEVEDWWKEAGVETTDKSIEISGELSGSDVYVCEITSTGGYPTPNFATQSAEQV
jgi:hypothetical protein